MRTIGFSNKVLATVYGACGAQLIALLVNVIATGAFDRAALAQAVGLGLSAFFGVLIGYQAQPDSVQFDPAVEVPAGSVEVPHGS